MKKFPIAVLDEHPDWLNPLYEKFTQKGYAYQKIDISRHAYNPEDTTVLPFYINRLSPSAAKRGHQAAYWYTLNYILYLESQGVRVINGSHTVLLETSKAQQANLVRKLQLPQPRTLVTNNPEQVLHFFEQLTFPVLVKPNCSGSGFGIVKYATKHSLQEAIRKKKLSLPQDNVLIVQEFIQPKEDHIVRVETINGKVVYAMKVFSNGTFNLCPSDSCDINREEQTIVEDIGYCPANPSDDVRFELYRDLPGDIVSAIEKLVKEARLECGGIEYVVDEKGNWYIYDINALSILRSSFKEEYGIDGWELLANYFIAEYEKIVK